MENLSFQKMIQNLFFKTICILTGVSGLFLLVSHFQASSFIDGGAEKNSRLGDIAHLEKEVGLLIQEWKNTLIRGNTQEGYAKYAGNFDKKAVDIQEFSEKFKVHLNKDQAQIISEFQTGIAEAVVKYKSARGKFINSTTYSPHDADKAVKGIDRHLLDGIRKMTDDIVENAKSDEKSILLQMWLGFFIGISLLIGVSFYLYKKLTVYLNVSVAQINDAIEKIENVSTTVSSASNGISSTSQQISQAATEQAASLEETASSIEEMSSMIGKNSDNAASSVSHSEICLENTRQGKRTVEDMIKAMDEINLSNNQIAQIVSVIKEIDSKTQVINDIVFQTKLLSFNASVEAARAGEHGKGFSVVAEEVGNLASMSGSAAEEISELLKSSIQKVEGIVGETGKKVDQGTKVAHQCGENLDKIVESVNEMAKMSTDISAASGEQAQGIQEISKAMSQLDEVTQHNASASEQAAGSAQMLSAQSEVLKGLVGELIGILDGTKSAGLSNHHSFHHEASSQAPLVTNLQQVDEDDSGFEDIVELKTRKNTTSPTALKSTQYSDEIPDYDDPRFKEI